MKCPIRTRLGAAGLSLLCLVSAALAQDTVTVSRARFEELERKEKALDRLTGELSSARSEAVRLKQEKDEAVARATRVIAAVPAEPGGAHVAPPLDTLPPLAKETTVDALDLVGHYRTDPVAADARYRKQPFIVRGEIIGFEKPMMTRNYHVLLRAADRQMRVLCVVAPPEKYRAVFTTQGGTVLTGSLANGGRVALLRIGQTATLAGRCGGADGLVVEMNGCVLRSVE